MLIEVLKIRERTKIGKSWFWMMMQPAFKNKNLGRRRSRTRMIVILTEFYRMKFDSKTVYLYYKFTL